MSAIKKLEQRLSLVEAELACLKKKIDPEVLSGHIWLDRIYGSFANDPEYDEAMRLGRKYRESTKPKPRKGKNGKRTHVDS